LPYPDEFLAVPPITWDIFATNWWQVLKARQFETGYITVPKVEEEDDLPEELEEGITFVHRSDRVLGLLEKINVLRKRPLYEERLFSDETLRILDDIMTGHAHILFEYYVCERYDPWRSLYNRNYMRDQSV